MSPSRLLFAAACLILPSFQGCQLDDTLAPAGLQQPPPHQGQGGEQRPVPGPAATPLLPSSQQATADNGLAALINTATLKLVPDEGGKPVVRSNMVFKSYAGAQPKIVAWGKNWPSKLDMTGVAWDRPQTLTLVSPRHALMAKHYSRKVGKGVVFHDKTGKRVQRKVVDRRGLKGTDIGVALLDRDVPAGVKHYRVLAPSPAYVQTLPGAYALVTNQKRSIHLHEIEVVNTRPGGLRFRKASNLPDGYYRPLVKGDSGHPSFLWLRGEPVLIETHTGGGPGSGAFFGSPLNFAAINASMAELSRANSAPVYQLKTLKP